MTARLTLLPLVAMVIAALVAGCGGGGDNSESAGSSAGSATTVSTSSLTKAQFVQKANAVCERGRQKFLNYRYPSNPPTSERPFSEAVKVSIAPDLQEVVDGIRDLGAPQGDEPEIEAYLSAMQQGIDTIMEDHASLKTLPEVEASFLASAKLAHEYGAHLCGFG